MQDARTTHVSAEAMDSAAVDCFLREHDRWNHWMLFFYGAVVSVFIGWYQLRATVPLWAACFIASAIAWVWVMAAINIRISAVTWFETARRLELGLAESAFHQQAQRFEAWPRWSDFRVTLNVFSRSTWHNLTRILVLFAFVVALTGCFWALQPSMAC